MPKRKIFFSALFCMASCGPVYSTDYRFTPPRTPQGSRCVDTCEDQKDRCAKLINQEYNRCETRKERYYTQCSNKVLNEKGRAPKTSECGSIESCSNSTVRCDEIYRSCYQGCGGTVIEDRRCVLNCEEAAKKR